MTKYKHISFLKDQAGFYVCVNNHTQAELGKVEFYTRWKKWCYFPTVQAVYSSDCLQDIANFLEKLDP